MIVITLGLKKPPRKKTPRVFVPQMKANALHRQEAAASCLLDRDRGTGRAVTTADSPVWHPATPPLSRGGALCGRTSDCSGMTNVLKRTQRWTRLTERLIAVWYSGCDEQTGKATCGMEVCVGVGAWVCRCVWWRGAGKEARAPLWSRGSGRGKDMARQTARVWRGGGEDGWMRHEEGQRSEMKMKLGFSYWAAALSPSPRPRILTTTPLLLHSGKKRNGGGRGEGAEENIQTLILHMYKGGERRLLFRSPWHRVCLFCVCTRDWKQERLHKHETRASPSVWTSLGSACTVRRRTQTSPG